MKKRHKEYNLLSSVLKSLIFAFLILVGSAFLFGFKPIIVMGASAEPQIHYRSLIIIKKCPKEDLKLGDFVTFTMPEGEEAGYITHQIYQFLENGQIVVKGYTYNESLRKYVYQDDSQTITYDDIKGKVVWTNYLLGNTIYVLQNNPPMLVGIVGGIILAFIEIDRLKTNSEFNELNL